jgi:ABC-type sugar transport system substrate-binding protein
VFFPEFRGNKYYGFSRRKNMKKTGAFAITVAIVVILAGMIFAGCARDTQLAPMTPAAQIQAPPGVTLLSLPVDQVSDRPLRIAALMMQTNPFGIVVWDGQRFAGQILADRNVLVTTINAPDWDVVAWTNLIDQCIAAGYDAIVTFGVSNALTPAIRRARDAGIPVFLFNSQLDAPRYHIAWYGQGGMDGGRRVGSQLATLMGYTGEFAIITGDFTSIGHEQRRLGAREVLDAIPGMTLVAEIENHDTIEGAFDRTQELITAFPNLRGIYVTAGGPSGAARALINAGLQDQIILVCHDVLPAVAQYIADGVIRAALDQDPFNQGFQPIIDAFNYIVAGIRPPAETFYDGAMVTPATVRHLFPGFF